MKRPSLTFAERMALLGALIVWFGPGFTLRDMARRFER